MDPKSSSIKSIKATVQQLIDAKKIKLVASAGGSGSEVVLDSDCEILSEVLSQLEMLEGEDKIKQSFAGAEDVHSGIINEVEREKEGEDKIKQSFAGAEDVHSCIINEVGTEKETECQNESIETKEIVKELKNMKKQNKFTHWLLSGLILVTVGWQLSQYSMLLKVRDGFSHPFRSVRDTLGGMLKRHDKDSGKQGLLPPVENLVDTPVFPINVPRVDLPGVATSEED